jgi:hypothetical protein
MLTWIDVESCRVEVTHETSRLIQMKFGTVKDREHTYKFYFDY